MRRPGSRRAGLLHDFFLYDPREGRPSRELQPSATKVAAGPAGKPLKFLKKKGTPYCPICSRWDPFPNPGKHGLYPARTKYAPVRKYSILRLHWQETDAWQSARRKDEGFLSNCIKSAGEDAFQGAVSLTAVQGPAGFIPRRSFAFCLPIVKRLRCLPGLKPAARLIVMQSVRLTSGSRTSTC